MISRLEAIKICEEESSKIHRLLILCVLFKNNSLLPKWVNELAESLYTLDCIRIKNQGNKVQKYDLDHYVFNLFGKKLSDAQQHLEDFCMNIHNQCNCEFSFNDVRVLFTLYADFKETYTKVIRNSDNRTKLFFIESLNQMMDKHLKEVI